jgi:hypothetical protein
MSISAVSTSSPIKPPEASVLKPPEVKVDRTPPLPPVPPVRAALPPGQGTRIDQLA